MCIKGLVYRLSHDCHFNLILIATFRLHTAGRNYRLLKTYNVGSKRRNQYQSDNRETNAKLNTL